MCSDCSAAQWNARGYGHLSAPCTGSLEKESVWAATSRRQCSGFLLISQMLSKGCDWQTSTFHLVMEWDFCPSANAGVCIMFCGLSSQLHRATPAYLLIHSIGAGCSAQSGPSLEALNCNVIPVDFVLPSRTWFFFLIKKPLESFVLGIFGAKELWQYHAAGAWVHVELFCRPNALQWELPPKINMYYYWGHSCLFHLELYLQVCCGCALSYLWAGGWHRPSACSRLGFAFSSCSLPQCCCRQRCPEVHGAFAALQPSGWRKIKCKPNCWRETALIKE